MPTKNRVRGAIVEITDKLERIGYTDYDVVEPQMSEDEDEDEDEEDDHPAFYIFVRHPGANFYVALPLETEHGDINYPFRISTFLANRLTDDEIEQICENSDRNLPENSGNDDLKGELAGIEVIENSSSDQLGMAQFHLSAYASTALVDYEIEPTRTGFPSMFRCRRGVLPYTDDFSLRTLDNRTDSVIAAGKRGRRYVEASFFIDKEGDPTDYGLEFRF